MAFCTRSERKMEYLTKDYSDVGPGQYFQTPDKKYMIKRIHPPFHIAAKRTSYFKIDDNPGPGSYDLIDKSLNNNKDSTFNSSKKLIRRGEKTSLLINNTYTNNISSNAADNTSYLFEVSKNTTNKTNKSYFNNSENNETNNYLNINTNSKIIIKKNNFSTNFERKNRYVSKLIKYNRSAFNLSDINNNSKEPGPGSYDYDLNTIQNNILKLNKNPNKNNLISLPLRIEAGSLNRIISIPSKDMNGYTYDYNKKLNLLIDKTNTNEYIGPGKYDINTKYKPKSILDWSKTLNVKEIKQKKDILKRNKTLEELKKRGDIMPKLIKMNINDNKNLLKAHFISGNHKKGLNDLNNKLFANNINKRSNMFIYSRDSFILDKTEIPGPGYYTLDIINNNQNIKNTKNKKKNMTTTDVGFGSTCNRFIYKNKSMKDLGPATYFMEKNKFQPNDKPDIFSHLKNKRLFDDTIKPKKEIINNPGPGTYNLGHSFINKSYGRYELMDNKMDRFKYINDNDNPGPGTYNSINNIDEEINTTNNTKIDFRQTKNISMTFDEEEKKRKMEKLEKIKSEKNIGTPGVGAYNLEEVDSINYNMKKKLNPILSYNSPFLISSKRFNYKKNDKIDSSTTDTNYPKKIRNYMAFSKAERFKNNLGNTSNYLAGPGSYNLSKDEQWNKRTFNKLFSS